MRKLLNTLYITSEDLFLSYSNGNVVVNRGDEITARCPLLNLDGIITFSYAGATPALMGECAKRGIQLTFMTPNGRECPRGMYSSGESNTALPIAMTAAVPSPAT